MLPVYVSCLCRVSRKEIASYRERKDFDHFPIAQSWLHFRSTLYKFVGLEGGVELETSKYIVGN